MSSTDSSDLRVPLRVLVVDDSALYRKLVSDALTSLPGIEVVDSASNGRIALEKIRMLKPDLITLDYEMPELNGLELLQKLRTETQRPEAIMLSSVTSRGADVTIAALEEGALDFVLKPNEKELQTNQEILRSSLQEKLRIFAVKLRYSETHPEIPTQNDGNNNATAPVEIVCVGVSTGGPEALREFLPEIPDTFQLPMVIVQHMPPLFTSSLAKSLDQLCSHTVCEATHLQQLEPGTIYLAPGGKQMKLLRTEGKATIQITDDPPECSCRPSVDYLFRSVAEIYGAKALAIIMTGMGIDGSAGARLLHQQGARILAQDEETSVIYGMPRLPIEEGIATPVPLDKLASRMMSHLS